MAKKNGKKQQLMGVKIIERAANLLQIGSIHAFVLYQVIRAMEKMGYEEIREMSKAIAQFERMGRKRRFIQDIKQELGEGLWVATFHKKEEEQEAV